METDPRYAGRLFSEDYVDRKVAEARELAYIECRRNHMRKIVFLIIAVLTLVLLVGCGESEAQRRARLEEEKRVAIQKATSDLNVLADTWDGTEKFDTHGQTDPWGSPYVADIDKGTLHFGLVVRSGGPDRLPKNRDDIIVYRSKRHGETTINKEVERFGESATKGMSRGAVTGIKEGIFGKKEDVSKPAPTKKE